MKKSELLAKLKPLKRVCAVLPTDDPRAYLPLRQLLDVQKWSGVIVAGDQRRELATAGQRARTQLVWLLDGASIDPVSDLVTPKTEVLQTETPSFVKPVTGTAWSSLPTQLEKGMAALEIKKGFEVYGRHVGGPASLATLERARQELPGIDAHILAFYASVNGFWFHGGDPGKCADIARLRSAMSGEVEGWTGLEGFDTTLFERLAHYASIWVPPLEFVMDPKMEMFGPWPYPDGPCPRLVIAENTSQYEGLMHLPLWDKPESSPYEPWWETHRWRVIHGQDSGADYDPDHHHSFRIQIQRALGRLGVKPRLDWYLPG